MNKIKWMLVLLIIVGAVVFRTYNFERTFSFAHDQDLYSWIAKDILGGHLRTIGQITSVEGVFIGPMYYYIVAVFYGLSQMNPLSMIGLSIILTVAMLISIYFIIKEHFGKRAAIIIILLYAFSYGLAAYERWAVPTQLSVLWSLWFLQVIFKLAKGDSKYLIVYGLLIGLIWEIHIAFLPLIFIPILAGIGSKFNIRIVAISLIVLILTLSPFLVFEIKHNFSQSRTILSSSQRNMGGPSGWQKVDKLIDASGREMQQRLLFGWDILLTPKLIWMIWIFMFVVVVVNGKLGNKKAIFILSWIILIMAVQFVSKRVVSEYYFTNFVPIFLLIFGLFIDSIPNKLIILVFFAVYIGINVLWLRDKTDVSDSYFYKKQVVAQIKEDALKKGYPCLALNFISSPGTGVGFRYLFWYNRVNLIKPSADIPIYNIVIPWQVGGKQINAAFGRLGIIYPTDKYENLETKCQDSKRRLDPLLGYTE